MRIRMISVFIATLVGISGYARAGIRVVSDIDDTAKITNVGSPTRAVWNGLFSLRSFTGMPELYSSFSKNRSYSFDYLSASPEAIRSRILKFIRANGYPEGAVHLRPTFYAGSSKDYKWNALLEILEAHPDDQFILIGDDTESDSEIYARAFHRAPAQVLAIYIRKVENRPLPPSSYPFLTAFDIARMEYVLDRLDPIEAEPVASAILKEPRDSRIFPPFTYCPVLDLPLLTDPEMDIWSRTISDRVRSICMEHGLMEESG